MTSTEIADAEPYDATWVKLLLPGLGSGAVAWSRYWRQTRNSHARGVAERWRVIRPFAFCHYRQRQDGTRVIDEIAVMPTYRRQGLASRLVREIGLPVEIHVPAWNTAARAWAEALRFQPTHTVHRRQGRLVVYRLG